MDGLDKSAWRRQLRQILRAMDHREAERRSEAIVNHLAEWLVARDRRVAMYAALPGEPNVDPLARRDASREYCYPRVKGSGLSFHLVPEPDAMRRGLFGIREPNPETDPEVAIEQIGVFLCPALGFARDGTRLGRGKGYYDRALALARPDALRVGVGFAVQMREQLPCSAHDQRMTHLADETGVREARPTRRP